MDQHQRLAARINALTEEQYDSLCNLVQVNVDFDDYEDDINEAEKSRKVGSSLYVVKDGNDSRWLFFVNSFEEIDAIIDQAAAN